MGTNILRTTPAERPVKDQPKSVEEMGQDPIYRIETPEDRAWDAMAASETVFSPRQPRLKLMERAIRHHLRVRLGRDFNIGFFTDRDLPDRKRLGYIPITKTSLPSDAFDDAFCALVGIDHAPDGTYRCGMVNELRVCWIRSDVRDKVVAAQEAETKAEYARYFSPREGNAKTRTPSITAEIERAPLKACIADAARDAEVARLREMQARLESKT